MKITIEPTGVFETIRQGDDRCLARMWRGTSNSGVEVICWIPLIGAHKDGDQADFLRELNEVKADRHLVSFDMRMIL
jgi:hypothetical protein